MPNFRDILGDGRLYFFDGGYGTLLQSRGMPPGLSPEMFGLKNPEVVRRVHEEYLEAGADVLTTNTFGGTRHKLGPGAEVTAINRELAALARRAAGDRAFVAGSVGPSGHFVEPLGELTLADLVQAFKEQITGLVQGGVDLILAETHFDLAEAKAVVLAAREVCDLPVAVSMTFEAEKSLTGTPPLTFVDTMQNLGVEVVATNCGAGPEQILAAVRAMLPRLETPLLVEPNAGLPELDERGRTVFRLGPGPFAQASRKFAALGAKFVGGCCGTTPEHIRALRKACQGQSAPRPEPGPGRLVLTCRSASAAVGFGHPAALIGERINPTGKKDLAQDLAQGRLGAAQDLAQEQIDAGAPILDVNVGAAMVDEQKVLPELVKALSARFQVPLSIDSADARAIEAALWVSAASPLVNSISGEPGRMEVLGPLCARFGAPFILLPIPGKDLPLTASERLAVIERLLGRALDLGVPKRLVLVDALALTVSSKPEAARHCLETIRLCRENLGLPCVVGLSNISFGLPARELLNSAFLSMARGQGLCALIANPGSARVREALAASEVLMDRDPQAARFIAAFSGWRPGGGPGPAAGPAAPGPKKARGLYEAVVQGAKDVIL
ncbi:MAG: homocysteine S-methyltransferase family protein, partial [Desulfovibrionaceae bacterium]|nr:homocysteine S-methyltransferase family protein [Desulfovibrionaceae bacterium]